jgi:putative lipoic acid-binding regulatory protein
MEPERIVFPTDYPIKVMARASAELRNRVDAVFEHHFGDFEPERVTQRSSAANNFVALTYLIYVQREEQLARLHDDLRALEEVILVL